jgi:hypothetical protein
MHHPVPPRFGVPRLTPSGRDWACRRRSRAAPKAPGGPMEGPAAQTAWARRGRRTFRHRLCVIVLGGIRAVVTNRKRDGISNCALSPAPYRRTRMFRWFVPAAGSFGARLTSTRTTQHHPRAQQIEKKIQLWEARLPSGPGTWWPYVRQRRPGSVFMIVPPGVARVADTGVRTPGPGTRQQDGF